MNEKADSLSPEVKEVLDLIAEMIADKILEEEKKSEKEFS